jgi:hypothetical protein
MGSVTITVPFNPGSLEATLLDALGATDDEKLYAGSVVKTGILTRTSQSVDSAGIPFAAYSHKGPYYWYPRSSSAGDLRKLSPARKKQHADKVKRILRKLPKGNATATGSGLGIRFDSYAAAKKSFARAGVDLTGLQGAPHMLQQIVIQLDGQQVLIGIYDPEAAEVATAHNTGGKHLPKRHFFDVSEGDLTLIAETVGVRMVERVRKSLGV